MILFKDIFSKRESDVITNYIKLIEFTYSSNICFKKAFSNYYGLNQSDIQKNNFKNNIAVFKTKYNSYHFINTYEKIKPLLKRINSEVKSHISGLIIEDLYMKKWANIETIQYKKPINMYQMDAQDIKKIEYKFYNTTAIYFTEKCQIFYDDLNKTNFDNSVICPIGSVLFLHNEHFQMRKIDSMYSLGLGYTKIKNNLDSILNYNTTNYDTLE